MRNRIPKNFGDLVVGVLLVIFIASAGVSAVNRAQATANKAKCASNLHQIGLAILLYQQDNLQWYPRTVADNTGNPVPVWGTPYEKNKDLGRVVPADPFKGGKEAPAENDVTSALFLLLRTEQLTPAVFICPDAKLEAWDLGGGDLASAQDWTNWQGNDGLARHLSYSYENPYPSNTAIANGYQLKHPDATFAVASDMNPGGDAVKTVTLKSTAKEMKAANSLNHFQEGQNVLYGDGHVEWQTTPFVGTQHDNIFTACGPEIDGEQGRGTATIVASPCGPTDSILLPTAADIGYKGPPAPKPLSAAEADQLKKDIQGTYAAPASSHTHRPAVLVVDDKTIKCTTGPATILYNYEVTGTNDGTLQLALTAPDTKTTASVSLDGNTLKIEMTGDFALNLRWQRVDAASGTTQP